MGGFDLKKVIYIVLGSLTFALGTLGIFLPFLPTTGFYLLTGFFWLRSSEKLYLKFTQSSYYQTYIVELFVKKKMTKKGKVKMFLSMAVVFSLPIILVSSWWLKLLLVSIYFAHVFGLLWYFHRQPKIKFQAKEIK